MSEKNTKVRRITIQKALGAAVESRILHLKNNEGLDLARVEDARRLVRAMVRLACEQVLAQHGPELVASACIEAVARELEAQVQTFVAESPAQTQPSEPFPC